MSIVNKIDEVMKNASDAKITFGILREISIENNKDVGNTFDIAFCSVDPLACPDFCKEFVECYLKYESQECYMLFDSLYLAGAEMENDTPSYSSSHVYFLKICIQTFFAHQKNFSFIPDFNALNILEKEFSDKKSEYTIAFNQCVDFMKSKKITSNLDILNQIEVLKF